MTNAIKLEKVDRKIVILTATSGDTGTASMCGFQDVDGTQVIVFYPHNGVAPIQLKQMFTQPGDNLNIVAVEGNFDDAQTYVKQIFNDPDFREQLLIHHDQFSSANSMNIGRLIPQITYYFNAYTQLVQREVIQVGDKVNFSVPTGNFGDILAGYYAKKLGLPINKLICASDSNNVLTDFFKTGEYDKRRDFNVTISPSMDILVSSNLERLLFDAADQDYELISQLMDQLTTEVIINYLQKFMIDLAILRLALLVKMRSVQKLNESLQPITMRLTPTPLLDHMWPINIKRKPVIRPQ